jgi:hypothetical protein
MAKKHKVRLPRKIRTKEDIANFFAYLLLVDRLNFHPDTSFLNYVSYDSGTPLFGAREALVREELLKDAFIVADKNKLDIYGVGLDVLALTDLDFGYFDPSMKKDAPAWLKKLSRTW